MMAKTKRATLKERHLELQKVYERCCYTMTLMEQKIRALAEERIFLRSIVTGTTVSRSGSPGIVAKAMGVDVSGTSGGWNK